MRGKREGKIMERKDGKGPSLFSASTRKHDGTNSETESDDMPKKGRSEEDPTIKTRKKLKHKKKSGSKPQGASLEGRAKSTTDHEHREEVEDSQGEGNSHPGETNNRATLSESPGEGLIEPDLTTEEVPRAIVEQNEIEGDCEDITVTRTHSQKNGNNAVIVEVTPPVFQQLKNKENITIGAAQSVQENTWQPNVEIRSGAVPDA
ncbi:hypothetical protein HPB47_020833 [Ixodes persulcatus]|uniref:Uncharacterized protein n=1 Tax=Ixodes persulcatus TaxID=34615 RepID=A0AC60QGB2_IXOPE|nr:hypothetical protein HPB47_020833 [Ixodes persulcatus]